VSKSPRGSEKLIECGLGDNPFARKSAVLDNKRNPFARKPEHSKAIQQSESFFNKVEAVEVDQNKQRAVNRKGKDKEKKDLSRQTTLFGLPPKQTTEKGKSAKKGEETGANDIGASASVPPVPDADMSEVPPSLEAATLVESQNAEAAPAEETQPVEEDEVPIEWEASPPPASP